MSMSGISPVIKLRGGTYTIKFGTAAAIDFPKADSAAPNTLAGNRAKTSADRPTTTTPSVNMAVRNGEEKAENTWAKAMTTAISNRASTAQNTRTRRSAGTTAAVHQPMLTHATAMPKGIQLRTRGSRHATKLATPTTPRPKLATLVGLAPPTLLTASSSSPASKSTKTNSVSQVPANFPTRYSQRATGRARIGNAVFNSSSR